MRDGASSGGRFPVHCTGQAGWQARREYSNGDDNYIQDQDQAINICRGGATNFFCSIEDAKNVEKKTGVI